MFNKLFSTRGVFLPLMVICTLLFSGCQYVQSDTYNNRSELLVSPALDSTSSARARPVGIFISGGKHQEESILQKPFVDGALIRVRWSELEPEQGKFNWRYLDGEIAKVAAAKKSYTLAVVGGPSSPSWLYEEGAKSYSFSLNNPYASKARPINNVLPLPWDKIYLKHWHRVIAEVGRRYSEDPNLALVHITLSSQNGFEMHLPYSRGPRDPNKLPAWKDFGFTEELYIDAAKSTIEAFARAFPSGFLDLEIHPIFESYRAPTELAKFGYQHIGNRFGLFGAWLNNRNIRWDQPLKEMMKEYSDKSFCNYQLIGNATRQMKRVGEGGLQGAIASGLEDGCHYYEIWDVDIKNSDFEEYLIELNSRLKRKN